jgi:stage II sporulation protein D
MMMNKMRQKLILCMSTLLAILLNLCPFLQANEKAFETKFATTQEADRETTIEARAATIPSTIKILLSSNNDKVNVEIKGAYRVIDPYTGELLTSGSFGRDYPIVPIDAGIKWGEEFPDVYQIAIMPDDHFATTLVDGIQYRGTILIYQVNEKINVVNEIDMDDFCKSMLSTHLTKDLSDESLSAVAISTRTTAYYYLLANRNAYWHLAASEVDYQGYAMTRPQHEIDQSVEKTRELVMVYPEAPESTFSALWTENCAGKTVPFHLIFRREGFDPTKGVQSPYAALARKASAWKFSVEKSELSRIAGMDNISGINLYADNQSGKVYAVRFCSGPNTKDMSFFDLQHELGGDKLRSNDFTVQVAQDSVSFAGFGEGHGVGLCLYSAEMMAQKGHGATEILNAFFPGAMIKKVALEAPKRKLTTARSYAQRRRQ